MKKSRPGTETETPEGQPGGGLVTFVPRRERFVQEYLVDLNATQAAIRAGYSPRTAYQAGHRLVKDSEIKEAIAIEQARRAARVQISADRVLKELASIVTARVNDFTVDDNGVVQLADGVPDTAWGALAALERETSYIPQKDGEDIVKHKVKLKLWDKNSAIDKAMKHMGLLKDGVGQPAEERVPQVWVFGDKVVVFK